MAKELLFSVTAADCQFEVMRGTGPGGQKRNKTESKVRCTHTASGATAYSDATRSQHDNKRDAFLKMVNTPEFKKWHKLEIMRRMGTLAQVEDTVERMMAEKNLSVEVKENGVWVKETLDAGQKTV